MQEKTERIGHEELYDMLLSQELSWQEIIYGLIKSEQLNPWDIDLAFLAQKYIERIKSLEEESFFLSSKVLLAASILLRIKSEMLLERYIRALDEILFGKAEEEQKPFFFPSFSLEDTELLPKTPLPRQRRITLQELMQALDKAIETEQRRVRKEVAMQEARKDASITLPKFYINIRQRIKEVYGKIIMFLKTTKKGKMTFTELAGTTRVEKISTFVPLLHLDSDQRIFLEQEKPFDEIFITLPFSVFREASQQ